MIYFLYSVTPVPSNRFYLGKHCTKSLGDGYLGSGVAWKNILRAHPVNEFSRVIISYHAGKTELSLAERKLITQEVLNEPLCMNLALGGSGGDARNFYKNLTPREVAIKAAKTLKTYPAKLAERNAKVQTRQILHYQKSGCGNVKANQMRKGINKASRKKQGTSLSASSNARMTLLLVMVRESELTSIGDLEKAFPAYSRTSIYRALKKILNNAERW